ncbi:MAG: glycerate dehydrogenase [Sphingobacteriales bacterium]|nr:glycerate dehydrogenase [Sphingobacteriales bacterium]
MKIVVLDGYALNPGDLSWNDLEELGDLTVYDRTPPELVAVRSAGAEAIFTNKTTLDETVLSGLTFLKYIGVFATGYNIVDVQYAKKKGIIVTNVPGYSTASVVQLTFALLLELCLRVQRHSDSVFNGDWANSEDFSYWNYPLIELAGKTVGIIGFGSIGAKTADVAAAFGMNVIATSRTITDQSQRSNFKWVSMDELLSQADVVSLHCPLLPETKEIINEDSLAKMKRSAFLINTSRGQLINENALANALNNGTIAGAGLDVLSVEPPEADNPLFKAKNCLITPHIAWATTEARTRLMNSAVKNFSSFLAGNAENVVNA